MKDFTTLTYSTREDWLALRRQGLGGSDAATACGLNPYKQPFELYLEKIGGESKDELPSQAAYFGSLLEDLIAQEYAKRSGYKVRRVNQILKSRRWTWMQANLDRLVVKKNRGLECKASGLIFNNNTWGEPGTDEVPEYHLLQCQHYMAVTGLEVFDLAVLLGGNRFAIYTIPRDKELIEFLIDAEHAFWQRIENKDPPSIDYKNPKTRGLLKSLYPGTDGGTKVLSEELQVYATAERRAAIGIKNLEKVQLEARNRLLEAMGEAAIALFADGTGYTRAHRHRKSYTVSETDYIELRYTEKALEKSSITQ